MAMLWRHRRLNDSLLAAGQDKTFEAVKPLDTNSPQPVSKSAPKPAPEPAVEVTTSVAAQEAAAIKTKPLKISAPKPE